MWSCKPPSRSERKIVTIVTEPSQLHDPSAVERSVRLRHWNGLIGRAQTAQKSLSRLLAFE